MPRVRWATRDELAEENAVIPAILEGSQKDFRPPATIESDFERLLMHEVPDVNYTFELIEDWFAAQEEDYEHVFLRAQQTPIDWKSKIGNSDMSTNFKVDKKIPIHKGDVVIREDGRIYILNWHVQMHPNNQASQTTECNAMVSLSREVPDVVDERGMLIEKAHRETICGDIPVIHTEYAGRPDYMASIGIPGINADHLIICYMQWNSTTKNIRINDEFTLGDFTYRVINVSIAEVAMDQSHGVLTLNARRVAGGGLNG